MLTFTAADIRRWGGAIYRVALVTTLSHFIANQIYIVSQHDALDKKMNQLLPVYIGGLGLASVYAFFSFRVEHHAETYQFSEGNRHYPLPMQPWTTRRFYFINLFDSIATMGGWYYFYNKYLEFILKKTENFTQYPIDFFCWFFPVTMSCVLAIAKILLFSLQYSEDLADKICMRYAIAAQVLRSAFIFTTTSFWDYSFRTIFHRLSTDSLHETSLTIFIASSSIAFVLALTDVALLITNQKRQPQIKSPKVFLPSTERLNKRHEQKLLIQPSMK